MGNNSKLLSVSKKRKCRKQVARDLWKKQRIGSQRDSQRHENIIARDFSSSDDELFLIEQDNNPKENFVPGGRRVVDIGHLLSALKNINHKIHACAFSNIDFRIPPPPGGTAILPEYIHYYGYYYQVIVQCLSTLLPASRPRILTLLCIMFCVNVKELPHDVT
jgi:hypothetical protein